MNELLSEAIVCDSSDHFVSDLKKRFPGKPSDYYATENGRIVEESYKIVLGKVYRIHPRLLGGKGGFGSVLRALGAKMVKTTNKDACRDLSGRRMKVANCEKKLKEWIEKEPEREQQKKEKEQLKEHLKRKRNAEVKYFFDSKKFDEQKEKIKNDFEDAMKYALKKPLCSEAKKEGVQLKPKGWPGMDLGSDSSDDCDDDDDDDGSPCVAKKPKLEIEKKRKDDEAGYEAARDHDDVKTSDVVSDDNDVVSDENDEVSYADTDEVNSDNDVTGGNANE